MTRVLTPKELLRILHDLQDREDARPEFLSATDLEPQLVVLRRWQSERLARTYPDLLADKSYRAACQFFLSDIYAPRDFSQRDRDAEQLYKILSRFLPQVMLRLFADAILMNQLTNRLDLALARVLVEEMGVTGVITEQAYVEGYRRCDNYAERKLQIDLSVDILREAAHGARTPAFKVGLRLARSPALRAGWQALYDFLERGYTACKPMKSVDYFVDTIHKRETTILDRIYADESNPFRFSIPDPA